MPVCEKRLSPLAQGRGSKRVFDANVSHTSSRPSRRGVDRNAYLMRMSATRPVAPRAGAWIETSQQCRSCSHPKSPLAQGRGSKQRKRRACYERHGVAPRAGAWIETGPCESSSSWIRVAPRAGAWIETWNGGARACSDGGRPSRRGVDRNDDVADVWDSAFVAPRAGAWIETPWSQASLRKDGSPLAQGRGSKRYLDHNYGGPIGSPLAQGRGSKPAA